MRLLSESTLLKSESTLLKSESTLLKMETLCTKRRKEWVESPSFLPTYFFPILLLKPQESYARRSYLCMGALSSMAVVLSLCLIQGLVLAIAVLTYPQLWSVLVDPKNHAQQIGILSQEGFYYLPFLPLLFFLFSLAINWPQYYFWNRRAKRLQRQGVTLALPIAAAVGPEDKTVWPPAPTRKR